MDEMSYFFDFSHLLQGKKLKKTWSSRIVAVSDVHEAVMGTFSTRSEYIFSTLCKRRTVIFFSQSLTPRKKTQKTQKNISKKDGAVDLLH